MDILIKYRETKGLSRSQLAKLLGCSQSYVGHVERDIRRLSWKTAMAWEKKLGIDRKLLAPHIFGSAPIASSTSEPTQERAAA
jgi:transcriptional regulator with XRE-family HTH domain